MSSTPKNRLLIILILGALSTVSPFSIDMYLPAFRAIAQSLHTTSAQISLSVSSYFIGLALGQLFYGPLLDRFGRKPPLYVGLFIYIFASVGCLLSRNVHELISFRFLQSIGGCVAQVGALAMVRDFFPVDESAKILSLLMLILGVSPLFAPTIGSVVSTTFGWQWIFVLLSLITSAIVALIYFRLPEGHRADATISLRPRDILIEFHSILKNKKFSIAAFSGAFSFAGLFVYVAGSPVIFLDMYHIGPRVYGVMFALLAGGFIGGSQVNIYLSKKYEGHNIFRAAVTCQSVVAIILLIGVTCHAIDLPVMFGLLFIYLPCAGISYPNAAAIALSPFTRNAGSASALLGFIQMGVGAGASAGVGLLNSQSALPVFTVMAISPVIGLALLVTRSHSLQKSEINDTSI